MSYLLLINTWGGRRTPRPALLAKMREVVSQAPGGGAVELAATLEDSQRAIRVAADRGVRNLLVGGGDGTLHIVLNQSHGLGFTYGLVPMGTINALAACLGLPLSPVAALRRALAAKPVPVDVGRVNGTFFLCFASVGYDAAVVHGVSSALKNRLGWFAYAASGFRQLAAREGLPALHITGDGSPGEVTAHSLVLSNLENYAGMRLFPETGADSGHLSGVAIRGARGWPYVRWFGASAAGLGKVAGPVTRLTGTRFTVASEKPMKLQLDGDPVTMENNCEFRFELLPGAIEVLAG